MKQLIFLFCIAAVSCCGTKKNPTNVSGAKPAAVEIPVSEKPSSCLDQLKSRYTQEEKQNPPRKIYSYTYLGKTVYYVTAPCCDFFSDLFDNNCQLMGHPDGGITGRGDGKFPGFDKERTNEKLLWEDKRL